jgi:hypothetical protein
MGLDSVFGNGASWVLIQANSGRMTCSVRLIRYVRECAEQNTFFRC